MKPTIGRVVIYRSRTGVYSVPAIITATTDTLYQPNVDAGLMDGLTDDNHVHLTVLTPGRPGRRTAAAAIADGDFKVMPKEQHGISENTGGLYQEWDIPFDPTCLDVDFDLEDQAPATWAWPPRV